MELKCNLNTVNIRGVSRLVFATGGAGSIIGHLPRPKSVSGQRFQFVDAWIVFSTNKTTLLLDFKPLLLSIPMLQASRSYPPQHQVTGALDWHFISVNH